MKRQASETLFVEEASRSRIKLSRIVWGIVCLGLSKERERFCCSTGGKDSESMLVKTIVELLVQQQLANERQWLLIKSVSVVIPDSATKKKEKKKKLAQRNVRLSGI